MPVCSLVLDATFVLYCMKCKGVGVGDASVVKQSNPPLSPLFFMIHSIPEHKSPPPPPVQGSVADEAMEAGRTHAEDAMANQQPLRSQHSVPVPQEGELPVQPWWPSVLKYDHGHMLSHQRILYGTVLYCTVL
jgi:hypothetical protein